MLPLKARNSSPGPVPQTPSAPRAAAPSTPANAPPGSSLKKVPAAALVAVELPPPPTPRKAALLLPRRRLPLPLAVLERLPAPSSSRARAVPTRTVPPLAAASRVENALGLWLRRSVTADAALGTPSLMIMRPKPCRVVAWVNSVLLSCN